MSAPEDLFSNGSSFAVNLDVFSGPFEVLLSLISKHQLDVTEVAIAQVTDEFIAFIRSQDDAALEQMSEFVVVAATLLDIKAARLLPREADDDDELLAIFEARDILFAKLLQYRAFKKVAVELSQRMSMQSLSYARDVPLAEEFRQILPEVHLNLGAVDLAILAASALFRRPDTVTIDHIHDPLVPVDSQIALMRERLIIGDRQSFSQLCADARNVPTVVSRFLAVLEMLRNGEIEIEQDGPLQPLVIIRISELNAVAWESNDRRDAERRDYE
ncbi:segregation/condensation protein A [Arcanobacterium phocisimile]|uniref:Segregation and condensation protein A n=1 Tax=Arcanobacterium phocisimile TaxID=1302235 RepID=A0ABX7IJD5_9ACTO|nr:segregation/condensation protein A [Arcanobacterium phocisimile]QRV02965.1 segregation/condensation protein A [Arcanobacterium phocisimile]